MGQGNLREVRDGSGESPGGLGRDGNPRGSPRRVWGPLSRYGTSRGTLGVVRVGSAYPR